MDVGWHKDPAGDPRVLRYWNGTAWTFSASWADLMSYRDASQTLPGADVHAPIFGGPPARRHRRPRSPEEAAPPRTEDQPVHELEHTEAGIRCGRCGGTQFTGRRTAGQRGRILTAGFLSGGLGSIGSARRNTPKVQCVTCGTFYERLPLTRPR